MDDRPIYGEAAYLGMCRDIIQNGTYRKPEGEEGRYESFGQPLKFDLKGGQLPLLTTKKLQWKSLAVEMLWFISGSSKIDLLHENNVKIWDIWANENNDVGPLYGFMWRNWWTDPNLVDLNGGQTEVDQLAQVMKSLRDRPDGRSHVITAWRPDWLKAMSIKPCHVYQQYFRAPMRLQERAIAYERRTGENLFKQFETGSASEEDMHRFMDDAGIPRDAVSLLLTQRSCDTFLGVPFNIAQYSLLCHLVAHQLGCEAGEFTWMGGDTHIYENHVEQIQEQLGRPIMDPPRLAIHRMPESIDGYRFDDFEVIGYEHGGNLKGSISAQGQPKAGIDISKLRAVKTTK